MRPIAICHLLILIYLYGIYFIGGGGVFCCVCGLFEIYDDYLSDELSLNSFDFVPFFQVVLSSSLARYLTLMIVSPARCYQLAVLLRLNFIIVVKCLRRNVKNLAPLCLLHHCRLTSLRVGSIVSAALKKISGSLVVFRCTYLTG